MKYDYLIVGTGLFGATFAQHALEKGKTVYMIDKRSHIGGNVYTKAIDGINVHMYGAHIFHTSNEKVWRYVNRFTQFNHYVNRPKVCYQNKIFSFPINLMTLYQLWGVKTPEAARAKLDEVRVPIDKPKNLEQWILSQVGEEIYTTFIKGYTTKQWQCHPSELPSFIIRRLPIRLTFDDNYFNDIHQGIPIGGYTKMVENMLDGAKVETNVDYLENQADFDAMAETVVYTGPIDRYFKFKFGELDYRTLRFDTKTLDTPDYQGNAVINYTEEKIPYTRILEHKHFEFTESEKSVVTWEYPDSWDQSKIPYYPINNDTNNAIYKKYKSLAEKTSNVIFGGRLAEYRYYDMHQVIASAMAVAERIFK